MPAQHPVRKLRDVIFHQILGTIVKNSFRERLVGSIDNESGKQATKSMAYKDFLNVLGGNGGGVICVKFDGTSHELEIK
jgi:hypothetical protein